MSPCSCMCSCCCCCCSSRGGSGVGAGAGAGRGHVRPQMPMSAQLAPIRKSKQRACRRGRRTVQCFFHVRRLRERGPPRSPRSSAVIRTRPVGGRAAPLESFFPSGGPRQLAEVSDAALGAQRHRRCCTAGFPPAVRWPSRLCFGRPLNGRRCGCQIGTLPGPAREICFGAWCRNDVTFRVHRFFSAPPVTQGAVFPHSTIAARHIVTMTGNPPLDLWYQISLRQSCHTNCHCSRLYGSVPPQMLLSGQTL